MIYANGHPAAGFTPDLVTLGGAAGGEKTIDEDLAAGHKSKYTLTYIPGEKGKRSHLLLHHHRGAGTRSVQPGIDVSTRMNPERVRYNASGPADASSPLLQ